MEGCKVEVLYIRIKLRLGLQEIPSTVLPVVTTEFSIRRKTVVDQVIETGSNCLYSESKYSIRKSLCKAQLYAILGNDTD